MKEYDFNDRKVLVFGDENSMQGYFIEKLESACVAATAKKCYCAIAISGGKTPAHLYGKIAREGVITRVGAHVFFVDERFVPRESAQSNYRMIQERLAGPGNIPISQVHPVPLERSAELSAGSYENNIRDFFRLEPGALPVFDMVLLGLGADGHTASIFPGESQPRDNSRIAVTAYGHGIERVTLTLNVINKAANVYFFVTGREKSKAVSEVINGNNCLPAALVRPETSKPVFMLDEEAASDLSQFRTNNFATAFREVVPKAGNF